MEDVHLFNQIREHKAHVTLVTQLCNVLCLRTGLVLKNFVIVKQSRVRYKGFVRVFQLHGFYVRS